jgi:hypothetical protein
VEINVIKLLIITINNVKGGKLVQKYNTGVLKLLQKNRNILVVE